MPPPTPAPTPHLNRYGSEGDAFRSKTLHDQLPPYDLEADACNGLNPSDLPIFMAFTGKSTSFIPARESITIVHSFGCVVRCLPCTWRITAAFSMPSYGLPPSVHIGVKAELA